MAAYQVSDRSDSQALAQFLQKEGQLLLPMVQLIEQAQLAVDELIDVTGRATLEAVLTLSAQTVAGPKHPGRAAGDIRWHGQQSGTVPLADRKVRVRKPRLRRKGGGEVEVPAYEALRQRSALGGRMLEILMHGVSTRHYETVVPRMAETVGVKKSSVSRELIEASAQTLRALAERRFDDVDLVIIYLDGLVFGEHHVLAAIGVDSTGHKHVLGLREGASENAVVARELLEDLVARGVTPARRRLFVIDGAKALRSAIDAVFGAANPVQRCRRHKERNVLGYLPEDDRDRMRRVLKAAWKLPAAEGQTRLEKEAKALEKEHPSAAASLREGLAEMFTVNRLGLPPPLQRGLCSTNLIESSFSGARSRTRRVTHWQTGDMALRWAAAGLVATSKQYRRLMGYQHLWMLDASLKESLEQEVLAKSKQVG
jgi:transposase-like protein